MIPHLRQYQLPSAYTPPPRLPSGKRGSVAQTQFCSPRAEMSQRLAVEVDMYFLLNYFTKYMFFPL